VQAILLPITDKSMAYADSVYREMAQAGVRVETDRRNEKIGAKIRDAIGRKIPYLLVIGEREAQTGTVSVRPRDGEDRGAVAVGDIIEELRTLHRERR
jgi:threonyl-tRNA synthetase